MKKLLLTILFSLGITLAAFAVVQPEPAYAVRCACGAPVDGGQEGLCIDGKTCVMLISPNYCANTGAVCQGGVGGTVTAPSSIRNFQLWAQMSGGGTNGLIVFLNRIISLINIIVGIWAMFNFIIAGWTFLTKWGDPSAYGDVRDRLRLTLLGIILVVANYTIAGVVGLLLFGDVTYIINPVLCDATGNSPGCN